MTKKAISPNYFNFFFILMIGSHFLMPIRKMVHLPYNYLGVIIIFFGISLNIWAITALRNNNTPVKFNEDPTSLVIRGPYQISRNPLYLGGLIVMVGLAILLGSLIAFIFPILLFLVLNKFYIPVEEEKLERIFGHAYLNYKKGVRRWI